jgi:trimeric autotransporter adhesin
MHALIQLKKATPVFVVALVCFGLLPTTQAVVPAPDGGYPGGNTAEGQAALLSLTSGRFNTGVGFLSLRSNATGQLNTAIGAGTLLANTGDENTATGAVALLSNTSGSDNTANGAFALFNNTTGNANTANGADALQQNTTGTGNTATGNQALQHNTTGLSNTATGAAALFINTTGASNTATGSGALALNITGSDNTANGAHALFNNNTGNGNTANGAFALLNNTTGDSNTATGASALFGNTTGTGNAANGVNALLNNTTGNSNTALGVAAGNGVTTANNVICIGFNVAGVNMSNSCFIGNIYNTATVSGTTLLVIVSDQGQLGTTPSSRRFKREIKPMDRGSESILALKPVTFHYKSDETNTPQFGLIAEEVAEVNPNLVVRDKNGEIYTVRYEAVNAMLLNEFLKEHRKVEALKKDFGATIAQLTARLDEQASQIQKVSAQLEASNPAPRTVKNP